MNINKFNAFFFDRDNTLIRDKGFTYKRKDLKFLPGVIKGLQYLKKNNYKIIVITNQSGVAKKKFKKKNVLKFHNYMNLKLKKYKATIDDFFICTCHPDYPAKNNSCKCRKPSKLMLIKAMKKWSLNRKNIIMIGDKFTDKLSAKRANVKFYYKSRKVNLFFQLKKILKKN